MLLTLLFPPPFDISQPYLSLPTLAGFLRRSGIDVEQRDINLECYDAFISSNFLRTIYNDLLDANGAVNLDESPLREYWRSRSLAVLPALIDGIDDVKRRIRDSKTFFNPRDYARDIRYLHRACEAISARYFPTHLTPSSFTMRYRTSYIKEIISGAAKKEENPFIALFENSVVPSLRSETGLFGISIIYTDQLIPAITLARAIKNKSNAPIVVGGEVIARIVKESNGNLEDLFSVFDGIAVGDGSDVLVNVIDSISRGSNLDNVPHLITSKNRHRQLGSRAPMTSLDVLGRPDFNGLNLKLYFCPDTVLPLLSGKGCEWGNCVFCTESFEKNFAPRSIDLLLDDIEFFVSEHDTRHITFADSDIPAQRLKQIADGLLARNIRISWSCYARLTPALTKEIIETARKSGCIQIYFGLESASQRILHRMRKGIRIDNVPNLLQLCHEQGIHVHLFCFVGFPDETKEEACHTARFIEQNISHIGSFNIGPFAFRTYSEIFQKSEQFGVSINQEIGGIDGDVDSWKYKVVQGVSMDDAQNLSRELVRQVSQYMERMQIKHSCFIESGYVISGNVPGWQSHALFYLANAPAACDVVSEPYRKEEYSRSEIAGAIAIEECGDNAVLKFLPESGKIVRIRNLRQPKVI